MKKLDEIMELMADEMADFKSAVLQLQLLSKQLKELSIPISAEALEKNLNQFLERQELESQARDEILKSINQKLKNARIIPNYLLILFGALGVFVLGVIGYLSYSTKAQQEESLKIYRTILQSEHQLQEDFFSAYPKVKAEYFQWINDEK
ncbi:hypothetical protein FHG64_13295 [Antarcticibacterium flavum]|uniref:Uncharacterized protein n=1 Tax=Antarcticibacterium flavum TaxID=2058175 RepID=A0A5B7X4N3_9FLAO|nr:MULTISPECIES: DUF6730 family protein [Antarcticibacterium]MCM4158554.1 hypothetical protein [Antarcticibacterium sp. W02-3]QCY70299.1 hypothetical protein FHG64_13295 [Antarcticibacterium flavum]